MSTLAYVALIAASAAVSEAQSQADLPSYAHGLRNACGETASAKLKVDSGHPWRPPFGIDRVGAPLIAHVELTSDRVPLHLYYLTAYKDGRQIERQSLKIEGRTSPFFGTARLTGTPDSVFLLAQCASDGSTTEVARQSVELPRLEAQATARPDQLINPVDLGTILVPHDWLLLAGGQSAVIDIAALSRDSALRDGVLRVWFDGGKPLDTIITFEPSRRTVRQIRVPVTARGDTTVLHVAILDGRRELWRKDIRTMVVPAPPQLPPFGVMETKLRYDAPIAIGHVEERKSPTFLDYETAWDPKLKDVVVALPNGSRFVFWRGANYVPFWAGQYNTGLTYEWAEGLYLRAANAEGGYEMPEAINDKELRYSSIQILESTASRVHVRWTYQPTNITYQTWGDQPREDYYFYPDGFGTRVVTLTAAAEAKYELSEFISLIPQAAFPWEVLPEKIVEMLYLDGDSRSITLPLGRDWDEAHAAVATLKKGHAMYRIYQDRFDPVPVIYFSPTNPPPAMGFGPFHESGEMVTPAYWGDHWPLSRGKLTRYHIHAGLFTGPSHNSFMGWTRRDASGFVEGNPDPISISQVMTIDAQGKARPMRERRWAWLIAKSPASDEELRSWARSFSSPPSVSLKGARLDAPSYVQERRAIRLVTQSPSIEINVKPTTQTMNPVFEFDRAYKTLVSVTIDGKALPNDAYAWDGATLWMKALIHGSGASIRLNFR